MPWRIVLRWPNKENWNCASRNIDLLLRGIDLLGQISKHTETSIARWDADHADELRQFLGCTGEFDVSARGPGARRRPSRHPRRNNRSQTVQPSTISPADSSLPAGMVPATPEAYSQPFVTRRHEDPERVVRLTAQSLNRLLGLAGESLVESRWLRPFADSLQRLKRHQTELSDKLDDLRNRLSEEHLSERTEHQFNELGRKAAECRQFLTDRMQELEMFDRRSAHLSQRMYLEVLRTRMRPFSDGVRRFPRMVRDLARTLGKEVRLEICRREHPGGPRYPGAIGKSAGAPAAQRGGSRLRNSASSGCAPASLPKARFAWKRATAPACCWSRWPTTAPGSRWSACARPSWRGGSPRRQ